MVCVCMCMYVNQKTNKIARCNLIHILCVCERKTINVSLVCKENEVTINRREWKRRFENAHLNLNFFLFFFVFFCFVQIENSGFMYRKCGPFQWARKRNLFTKELNLISVFFFSFFVCLCYIYKKNQLKNKAKTNKSIFCFCVLILFP